MPRHFCSRSEARFGNEEDTCRLLRSRGQARRGRFAEVALLEFFDHGAAGVVGKQLGEAGPADQGLEEDFGALVGEELDEVGHDIGFRDFLLVGVFNFVVEVTENFQVEQQIVHHLLALLYVGFLEGDAGLGQAHRLARRFREVD